MAMHPFSALQYLLPHHAVSRLVHRISRARKIPGLRATMRWYVRRYGVRMEEAAESDIEAYPNFNSFFTRALRDGMRPLPEDPRLPCCPVDGYVSQVGRIRNGRLFQAKGRLFSLVELLGGDEARAAPFENGEFATLYLSPGDYHRIHMPLSGRLQGMVYVPGRLFSVGPVCVRDIPRLFARNERVACFFETDLTYGGSARGRDQRRLDRNRMGRRNNASQGSPNRCHPLCPERQPTHRAATGRRTGTLQSRLDGDRTVRSRKSPLVQGAHRRSAGAPRASIGRTDRRLRTRDPTAERIRVTAVMLARPPTHSG